MTRERAIQRVRDLLRLAESPNENEAANARENARLTMEAHNLTEEDVAEDVTVLADPRPDGYKVDIARAVATLLEAEAIFRADISFRGYKLVAEGCANLYARLVEHARRYQEIPAEVFGPLCPRSGASGGVDWDVANGAWVACFWGGYTASVAGRLRKAAADKATDLGAIVPDKVAPASPEVEQAKREIERAMDALSQRTSAHNLLERFRQQAFSRGRTVGDLADITPPPTKNVFYLAASSG